MEGATLDGHPLTRQLQVIYHQNRTPDRTHVPGCNVLQLQSKCRPKSEPALVRQGCQDLDHPG